MTVTRNCALTLGEAEPTEGIHAAVADAVEDWIAEGIRASQELLHHARMRRERPPPPREATT